MTQTWDRVHDRVEVAPGEAEVISWTKSLGAQEDTAELTRAHFFTGTVWCNVETPGSDPADLEVTVVAIDGRATDRASMRQLALTSYGFGAKSGESTIDFLTTGSGCEVRRVCGVSPWVIWENQPMEVDVSTLPTSGGLPFKMAMFASQSKGCEPARQSVDLLLYPPYAEPDSVGNYMMEYIVRFVLVNTADQDRSVDVLGGKDDAPIGLALQVATGPSPASPDMLQSLPVTVTWAGPRRSQAGPPYYPKSLLGGLGAVTVPARSRLHLDMRLMVVGSSSLPYVLILHPVE
jgi:hypothetical protein